MKVVRHGISLMIATSALDANSEYLVNDALQKVMRSDSTTLTIAHRLATIRRADWIIVLSSEGQVAEQGTYAQLSRKKDGAFNKLMQMQMEGLSDKQQQPGRKVNGIIYEEAEEEEKAEKALKEAEEARLEEERERAEQKEKGTPTIIE
jgi:putative ABC transport system ATP-binding protein